MPTSDSGVRRPESNQSPDSAALCWASYSFCIPTRVVLTGCTWGRGRQGLFVDPLHWHHAVSACATCAGTAMYLRQHCSGHKVTRMFVGYRFRNTGGLSNPKPYCRNGDTWIMKNIVEVLKQKEAELRQVQADVEALRAAVRLLSEDGDNSESSLAPTGTSSESRLREIKMVSDTTRQFP